MRITFISLLLFAHSLIFAQNSFTVIHVKGKIQVKSTGKTLERGTKISEKEILIYSSKDDLAAAISPTKGRVIIQPSTQSKSAGSELAFVLKDIYKPMRGNATTRGSSLLSTTGIMAFFKAGFLVLEENEFEFNENEFPLSDASFFFIRYSAEGYSEPINKKLPVRDGMVILNRTEFLSIDGNSVDPATLSNFELFYFTDQMAMKLTPMDLYLTPLEEIKEEISVIKKSGITNPFRECIQYMQAAYGNVDVDSLDALFNEE